MTEDQLLGALKSTALPAANNPLVDIAIGVGVTGYFTYINIGTPSNPSTKGKDINYAIKSIRADVYRNEYRYD